MENNITPFDAANKDKLTNDEYLWASSITIADKFSVIDDIESIPEQRKRTLRCLHGAMGIVTEVGEIANAFHKEDMDIPNLIEELGDVLWYIAIFEREYPVACGTLRQTDKNFYPHMISVDMALCAAEITDIFKRKLFYNACIDFKRLKENLSCLKGAIEFVGDAYGYSIEQVRAINIKKLWQRFNVDYTKIEPQISMFSEDLAINRNLELERAILEDISNDN